MRITNGPASGRIPELDGLRGFGILSVVLFHYMRGQGPDVPRLVGYFQRCLSLSWASLDLFFALSGFLIGGILLDARTSPSYFRTFYIRRFFRIIPAYYAWILCYILLVVVGGPFLRAHTRAGILPATATIAYQHFLFLQNIWDVPYVTLSSSWFSPTWSLAVEEQFYLISPLLVRLLSRRALSVFLTLTILGAPVLRVFVRSHVQPPPWLVYTLMPCRADALAIGVLLAVLWRDEACRTWLHEHGRALYGVFGVLLAGMLVLWIWFSDELCLVAQTVGYTWIALFSAAVLLLVLVRPAGPVARFARMNWLRELGRVSYCMYLIHEAVSLFCHALLRPVTQPRSAWQTVVVPLLAAALTYAIARLSWKYFEKPLLDRGHAYHYAVAPL